MRSLFSRRAGSGAQRIIWSLVIEGLTCVYLFTLGGTDDRVKLSADQEHAHEGRTAGGVG